jgi:hypothetical protein
VLFINMQPCDCDVVVVQDGTANEAAQPQAATADSVSSIPAAAAATLPGCIRPEQYTAAAFQADLDSSSTYRPLDADSIISARDPSTLLQATIDGTLGLTATVRLLEQDCIPPAALPVDCLVGVLSAWQADWESSRGYRPAGPDWHNSPVTHWVGRHWDDLTAEQVRALGSLQCLCCLSGAGVEQWDCNPLGPGAIMFMVCQQSAPNLILIGHGSNWMRHLLDMLRSLKLLLCCIACMLIVCCVPSVQAAAARQVIPGPAYGSNPDPDRHYAVARIKKALAGAARAAAAGGSSGGSGSGDGASVLPWQSGAEAAAAAERLRLVLAECDSLGPVAEWIKWVWEPACSAV